MSRFKQFLIREGREWETRDKQSRAAFGQGPVSPSMDTQYLGAILQILKPPPGGRRYAAHKYVDPRQLDLKVDDADSHLAHHQPIRRMFMS